MKYTIEYNQGKIVYFKYVQVITLIQSLFALDVAFTLIVEDDQS